MSSARREVKVLKKLSGLGKHPGVISIVESHAKGDIQWLTTPFHSGGDLHSFVKNYPEVLSDAFIWHTIYCVTDALHWLFYGVSSTRPTLPPRWYAFHGDLDLPNLLLIPATGTGDGPSGFPQIVIADLGSAEIYTQPGRQSVRDFMHQQALDLCFFGNYSVHDMTKVASATSGRSTQVLESWTAYFRNFRRTVDSWLSTYNVLNMLRGFHSAAAVRRLENVQPLPGPVVDAIAAVPVLHEHK